MAVSKSLHKRKVLNALIELPHISSDLYVWLHGLKHAPKPYEFRCDQIIQGQQIHAEQWEDGYSLWFPVNPQRRYPEWSQHWNEQLLSSIGCRIVIIDIGHKWDDPIVHSLCKSAAKIICVADAQPAGLSRLDSQKHTSYLKGLKDAGSPVEWVGNRPPAGSARREWLESFPCEPVCILPELDYSGWTSAVWRGACTAYLSENVDVDKLFSGF